MGNAPRIDSGVAASPPQLSGCLLVTFGPRSDPDKYNQQGIAIRYGAMNRKEGCRRAICRKIVLAQPHRVGKLNCPIVKSTELRHLGQSLHNQKAPAAAEAFFVPLSAGAQVRAPANRSWFAGWRSLCRGLGSPTSRPSPRPPWRIFCGNAPHVPRCPPAAVCR